MISKKFKIDEYSFLHSTLVLSNQINDIIKYFGNLYRYGAITITIREY